MTAVNLVMVLRSLCELDPPEITGQGIEESDDRTALASLSDLGALIHIGNSDSVLCLACDRPHSVGVEYAGAGLYRAYCPDSGYQQVRPEMLRRLVVDESWIASNLASAVGLNFRRDQSRGLNPAVARVGRAKFGPYACELFFGRCLANKSRFEEAKRAISGATGKAPAVLLTTTLLDLIPGEAPPRCALVPLENVLQVLPNQTSIDEGPIYAALRGGDHRFQRGGIGFVFSPGFRSAVYGDQEYSFTDKQALAVEALYKGWQHGISRLHQTEVQGQAATNQRLVQLFRGHPAYDVLIKHDGSGYYWLDL
jgi:hypothetical protein